jgi:hypothetical protein
MVIRQWLKILGLALRKTSLDSAAGIVIATVRTAKPITVYNTEMVNRIAFTATREFQRNFKTAAAQNKIKAYY